jgi:para-nitrobenzyl esterase
MERHGNILRFAGTIFAALTAALQAAPADQVHLTSGVVEGTTGKNSSVRVFLGIPYAAPPVGDARWKAPQPVPAWTGVQKADQFGAHCVQADIYGDMIFKDAGMSEDCLNLNVWTPAKSAHDHLPVMVWIYGGGFQAGATSEPRQNGEVLAGKGVVVVSMNYRLGIFGFYSHPELTKESGHNASGNYGLLDQLEALRWVQKNISAFGGDPGKVTIFGESAGSFSVSALIASPLAHGLFARAIGESGAFFGNTLAAKTLLQSEKDGARFATSEKAASLAELRAIPAETLLKAARAGGNDYRFGPNIDGYFLPASASEIYAAGKQSHVPLLAGWNADEGSFQVVMSKEPLTAEKFRAQIKQKFPKDYTAVAKLYASGSDDEALRSAEDLAGDQFIAFSTWKWIEIERQTGGGKVYRYLFTRVRPGKPDTKFGGIPVARFGAAHATEIEYVFGALDSNKDYLWEPADYKLSELMQTYWSNFAKTGDPNRAGLPKWPQNDSQNGYAVMHLDVDAHSAPEVHRDRYEFLDSYYARPTKQD